MPASHIQIPWNISRDIRSAGLSADIGDALGWAYVIHFWGWCAHYIPSGRFPLTRVGAYVESGDVWRGERGLLVKAMFDHGFLAREGDECVVVDMPRLLGVSATASTDGVSLVYFVQRGDTQGPIKIGTTRRLESRLLELQTSSAEPLSVLATTRGGRGREAAIHQQFAAERLEGEWFRPSAALLSFIASLEDTAP